MNNGRAGTGQSGAKQGNRASRSIEVSLLTGGGDRPYALGLAQALAARDIPIDFIASDELISPELSSRPRVRFLNLRGDMNPGVSMSRKTFRVLVYYVRLVAYAFTARPEVFHLLWNNKFEWFDRTLLMLYYRLLEKKIVFTVHNVNAAKRDNCDTRGNRATLHVQYRLAHHIFVHTVEMKGELTRDFRVPPSKVTVIPFGVNDTVPKTSLTREEARRTFNLPENTRTLLFFGNIAPYKGLEYLIGALRLLVQQSPNYRLIIGGRTKDCEAYWAAIKRAIAEGELEKHIIQRIEFIPDERVEYYFKAADVLVLPYTTIFQSGVLFLAYNFGLPVVASNLGGLKEDIVEAQTGFLCQPQDPRDLARAINAHFSSALFKNAERTRNEIQAYARERYSWETVGRMTEDVYRKLCDSTG